MFASLFSRGALSLAVVSLLTSSVAAEVLEKLSTVPQGWKYSHAPGNSDPIRLQIALQQQDVEGFEKALVEMSDPYHASYGKHFQSHDEMKRMLLPRQEAVQSVRSWLEAGGVTEIQEDADWINFRTTVGVANTLLDADFKWYVSNVRSVERLRTLSYSIPDSLVSHVHMIQPTTRFGQIQANRATFHSSSLHMDEKQILSAALQAGNSSTCDQVITPQCLKDLYNIGDYKADARSGSKVAFASYLEEYARYDDLAKFEEKLAPYAIGQNFSVIQYNGGLNDQNSPSDSGEANLDLQYMLGISAPLPITEFSVGGRGKLVPDLSQPDPNDNSNEPYLEFLQNVLKMPQHELPQVISTSYGEDEQTIPKRYALSVCNLFAQLGSRGVSVIFSSGDSGVGAACATNDGRNTTHFPPQFPAACPWVTSVGGTTNTAPEKAVYFSSGGFSDLWPRPAWQEAAVSGYLKKLGGTYRGLYNPRGRAFPDVAAQAMKYAVFDKGVLHQYAGTSCSSPMFGGIIGLLNDARLRAHQPPLGFLNPWLYSKASRGFNDIVVGGSTGCDGLNRFGGSPNGSPVVPYASWNATAGWDPVTGLGSPNFSKLLPLALRR